MQSAPSKILIISNEILGLGHLRIALRLLACIRAELQDVSMLLITASSMAHAFPLPEGLDIIKIPGVTRLEGDLTAYRSLRLPIAFGEVKKLRQRIIWETVRTYRPDLMLVDYRPAGVGGELLSILRSLKRTHKTALVLLLRDILDDPTIVRARWQADQAMSALEEYDEIWIYGCQNLYDPVRELKLPDTIVRKIQFCGYLDIEPPPTARREDIRQKLGVTDEPLVLVTIGNGRVGFPVLEAYMAALAQLPSDLVLFSLIVGGPELPLQQQEIIERQLHVSVTQYPCRPVRFFKFLPRLLDYMQASDLVVSLGGYNTVTEILRLEKRAIIVPYTSPNKEQLIRASLLESGGLIRTIHPDHLSPEILAESMLAALHETPPTRQRLQELGFDFAGLNRIKDNVIRLLGRGAMT